MSNVISLAAVRAERAAANAECETQQEGSLEHLCRPASDWHETRMAVELAFYEYRLADQRRICALVDKRRDQVTDGQLEPLEDASEAAFAEWQRGLIRQLFVEAPNVAALRWKEKTASRFKCHPDIDAALERDREALLQSPRKRAART